ncbi:hypothetical protein, partial [Sphingobacterium hungaricum]
LQLNLFVFIPKILAILDPFVSVGTAKVEIFSEPPKLFLFYFVWNVLGLLSAIASFWLFLPIS